MANQSLTYREEVDFKRTLQIRDICRELPQSCSDFIRSIAVTTGTFTRLAYAIDLRTFFSFLHQERISFSDKPVRLLLAEDLSRLSQAYLPPYT